MIMYRVSKTNGIINLSRHEIISRNKTTVHTGWCWSGKKEVERIIRKDSIWFESKTNAINKAREWGVELLDKAVSELEEFKALNAIDLFK